MPCPFKGPKKSQALEKSRFCAKGPFRILEMAHLVIFKGLFHNAPPHSAESIFSEPAPQIKALVRNLSAFTTLFAPGKSWDNVRSTAVPYTESRLAHLVRNKCVGFPVVEQEATYLLLFSDEKQDHC